ncbi:DUF4112 domain-containing protein [bacterium]|nr:MAG: DUF4112 domain-containing protein [bacterium]
MKNQLEQFDRLVKFLDDGLELPILNKKVGFDPIIGLIPFAGDAISLILNSASLFFALRLKASIWVLARMGFNILIDFAIGSIPVVGDVFDFFFKSNRKNYLLLKQFTENEEKLIARSKWKAMGFVTVLLLIFAAFLFVLYYFVATLFN